MTRPPRARTGKGELALDHVAFGVKDAASIAGRLDRLGFATAPSTCSWDAGRGESSAPALSVVFPGQYLDFVQNDQPRWIQHLESSPLYASWAAPSAIVLSGLSREEVRRRPGAYEIVRDLPGASPRAIHYQFCVPPDAGLPIGLIHDASPGAMRVREWLAHPNTAIGIRGLHVRVPSAASVADWLDADGIGIRLHEEPDDTDLREVAALASRPGRPALLAIEVEVADLAAARGCLERAGISFRAESGRLALAPGESFGTGLRIVGAP